jgi:hypothetical protein
MLHRSTSLYEFSQSLSPPCPSKLNIVDRNVKPVFDVITLVFAKNEFGQDCRLCKDFDLIDLYNARVEPGRETPSLWPLLDDTPKAYTIASGIQASKDAFVSSSSLMSIISKSLKSLQSMKMIYHRVKERSVSLHGFKNVLKLLRLVCMLDKSRRCRIQNG